MSLTFSTSLFWIGGGFIVLAAFMLVLMNKAVSTGHSLMFAIGAAVVLVPYVSNFEWSETGIKFTTRMETASLTRAVAATQDDGVQLRAQITELAESLRSATERIANLEESATQGGNAPVPSSRPTWTPLALDKFILQNEAAKADAKNRIETLKDFERDLMAPAIQ